MIFDVFGGIGVIWYLLDVQKMSESKKLFDISTGDPRAGIHAHLTLKNKKEVGGLDQWLKTQNKATATYDKLRQSIIGTNFWITYFKMIKGTFGYANMILVDNAWYVSTLLVRIICN